MQKSIKILIILFKKSVSDKGKRIRQRACTFVDFRHSYHHYHLPSQREAGSEEEVTS